MCWCAVKRLLTHSPYCYRPSSVVCRSVGRSVTLVSPEPIEMPFGMRTWVSSRNHVLDGSSDPPMGRGNLEGKGSPIVKYRDFLPCDAQFGLWTRVGRKKSKIQSYSPGGANLPTWEGTLAPPDEYDWSVRLRRRCGLFVKLLWPLIIIYFYYCYQKQSWLGLCPRRDWIDNNMM